MKRVSKFLSAREDSSRLIDLMMLLTALAGLALAISVQVALFG